MKSSRRILVAATCLAVLAALVGVVLRSPEEIAPAPAPERRVASAPAAAVPAPQPVPLRQEPAPVVEAEPEIAEVVAEEAEVVSDEDYVEPINWYNGMNPEDQPRTSFDQSFANLASYPDGFKVVGEDVRLSGAGWTLAAPSAGEEDVPRSGMIESPVLPLEFGSNAMNAMWREDSPEGTEVLVEIALSPDGKHWTDWFPTIGGHLPQEIPPTYPDGSPNPNHGYEQGDMVFWGLKQYTHFKYAITLYSESTASPIVSDFRMFYQDSTMGEGALATVGDTMTVDEEDASQGGAS